MGFAVITGGGTDGLYTISLDYGASVRDVMIAERNARIAELDAEIVTVSAQAAELRVAAADAGAAMNDAINAYADALQGIPAGSPEELASNILQTRIALKTAFDALNIAQGAELVPRLKIQMLRERAAELRAEVARLTSATLSETRQAWCVDLTEDGTGEVATIEIPGETSAVLIASGCQPWGASDGVMMAREIMSPEQVFWNAAVLPGWQKFKPTYRKGTITAVDEEADTASVSLDSATSSAQQLSVNQSSSLTDIPVAYMTCNAAAFTVGDRCIVEFVGQDWASPRVIGFVDNPQTCAMATVNYSINGTLVYTEEIRVGGTVIGWTAPATVAGFVDRPFIGWSDGVNTLAHPETVTALPILVYNINAEYLTVSDATENAVLIATVHHPNTYYPVLRDPPVDGLPDILYYMAQGHYSGVVAHDAVDPLFSPIDIGAWSGAYLAVADGIDPATAPTTSLPVPVSAASAVGSSFTVYGATSRGWDVSVTYGLIAAPNEFLAIYQTTSAATTAP